MSHYTRNSIEQSPRLSDQLFFPIIEEKLKSVNRSRNFMKQYEKSHDKIIKAANSL